MRFIDIRCAACGTIREDLFQRNREEALPACEHCGEPMERVFLPNRTAAVKGDDIPGGVWIKHGLCNPDGSPRKYYSHTEINREAEKRGLSNHVEHVSKPGSDKSPHTSRWV